MITVCWIANIYRLRLYLSTQISEGKWPQREYRFDDVLLILPDVKVGKCGYHLD